jgi:hypothetical protein
MKNYRKLTQKEADEIDNVGSQQEMNSVLSKYYLQVYKHRQYNEYTGKMYHNYILADCKYSTLVKELFPNVGESFDINYHLERVV